MAPRIGIIGGGQLALMLADAAWKLGVHPIIFAENEAEPAAQVFSKAVLGQVRDLGVLRKFFGQVDAVIFENEFVDCFQLKEASLPNSKFFPGLEQLSLLQDKLSQKGLLRNLDIPTPEFKKIQKDVDLKAQIKNWGRECVLKWSRFGYDGKGVFFVSDLESQWNRIESFCEQAWQKGSEIYIEEKVSFKRELAMVGVRSQTGEFVSYPLVLSEQKNGICHRVFSLQNESKNEEVAAKFLQKLASDLTLVGTFAVEFFQTSDGTLCVNEIAPRVHNSGHYSQDACAVDQFENHIRAVLGLPLGKPRPRPYFAMVNLLGPCSSSEIELPRPSEWIHLHWYGKKEVRKGRKLGHLNGWAETLEEFETVKKALDQCQLDWVESLKGENR